MNNVKDKEISEITSKWLAQATNRITKKKNRENVTEFNLNV